MPNHVTQIEPRRASKDFPNFCSGAARWFNGAGTFYVDPRGRVIAIGRDIGRTG